MTTRHERVFTVHIDARPEQVWAELTRVGSTQSFYFGSVLDTELRPGANLKYLSVDGRRVFVEGEVLEVVYPMRFAHTFQLADLPDAPSRVTFLLEPESQGVTLTVVHDELPDATKTFRAVARGWPLILRDLRAVVETGALPLASRLRNTVFKALLRKPQPKTTAPTDAVL